MIVVHIQGILENFLKGVYREYTGRIGVFDRTCRRQAIHENLAGVLGVGVLHLDLFLSTKKEGPKFKIAVEKLLEGRYLCIIGRDILITPRQRRRHLVVYGEAAVYNGRRGVLTRATGTWFGRGRLQETSVFDRTSLAVKVDRATAIFGGIDQLSVQCQYTIKPPIEGSGHRSKCWSSWFVYHSRTVTFLLLEVIESGNYVL